jgi:hypothetical protein
MDPEGEVIAILEKARQDLGNGRVIFSDNAKDLLRISTPRPLRVEADGRQVPEQRMPGEGDYLYYLALQPKTATAESFLYVITFAGSGIGVSADDLARRMRWHTDREGSILLRAGDLHITPARVSENFGSEFHQSAEFAMRDLLTANFPGRQISVPEEKYMDSGLGVVVGQQPH